MRKIWASIPKSNCLILQLNWRMILLIWAHITECLLTVCTAFVGKPLDENGDIWYMIMYPIVETPLGQAGMYNDTSLDLFLIYSQQVSRPAPTPPSTAVSQSNQVAIRRHPAPLPVVPKSTFPVTSNAAPPPKPTLSISKVNQGIVLSWNMTIDSHVHATIDFYNLYAYQETDAPPSTSLWKKIGDVKALPLPMACTLTQFQPGSMYHFAVCAIDIYHRTGPFSDASSINLPAIWSGIHGVIPQNSKDREKPDSIISPRTMAASAMEQNLGYPGPCLTACVN